MQEEFKTIRVDDVVYRLNRFLGCDKRGLYRLYRCIQDENPDRWLIFKIATAVEHNDLLDREAWLLEEIRERASETEGTYRHSGGTDTLNYHYICPKVVASSTLTDQGGRRVLVLGFDIADDIGELVPLSMVRDREHFRVDLKTSAWIIGKLLKTLVFVHSLGISVGLLTGSNLLVQRREHLVAIFDWSRAVRHPLGTPDEIAAGEILAVAQAGLKLLTEQDGKTIPDSDQDVSGRYVAMLREMERGREVDAMRAHASFYALVEELWGRKYHPWTTIEL